MRHTTHGCTWIKVEKGIKARALGIFGGRAVVGGFGIWLGGGGIGVGSVAAAAKGKGVSGVWRHDELKSRSRVEDCLCVSKGRRRRFYDSMLSMSTATRKTVGTKFEDPTHDSSEFLSYV